MTGWFVYLILMLDSIGLAFTSIIILGVILTLVCFIASLAFHEDQEEQLNNKYYTQGQHLSEEYVKEKLNAIYEKRKQFRKYSRRFFILIWPMILLNAFIPNTKQACVIYLVPRIANNEQVQKLPDNMLKLFNTKMEEWINDMDGKRK